jgi:hypothetical protein
MKMKKLIKLLVIGIFYFFGTNFAKAGDNKQVSFITGVGSSYREADVNAYNTAYMNGFKIVGKSTKKSGDIWVITARVVPR